MRVTTTFVLYHLSRVLWYTAMVGKHSSLRPLTHLLITSGVPRAHLFVTTLAQGLTHRWALAWTFCPGAAAAYKAFCVQSEAQTAAAVAEADRRDEDLSNDGSVIGASAGTDKRRKVNTLAIVHSFTTTVQYSALASTMAPSDSSVLNSLTYKPYFDVAESSSVNTHITERVVAAIEDTNDALSAAHANNSGITSADHVYVHRLTDVQHSTGHTALCYQVASKNAASVVACCIQYTIPLVDVSSTDATATITAGIHGVTGHCEKWR